MLSVYPIIRKKPKITKKVALLSNNLKLYSNKRIKEEAKKAGLDIDLIEFSKCCLTVINNQKEVIYKGKNILNKYQAVIPRIAADTNHFSLAVLRCFYEQGILTINQPQAINIAGDKTHTIITLAERGIDIPRTGFTFKNYPVDDLLNRISQPPYIIKIISSSKGNGVLLSESLSSARSTLTAIQETNTDVLVQEFIKESRGRDIRVFIVGGQIVASMERVVRDETEFRSNIHRGGLGRPISLTKQEENMAIKCSSLVGLDIAGIDLMRGKDKTYLIEVNASPGLQGIETSSGTNVAKKIVDYVLSRLG